MKRAALCALLLLACASALRAQTTLQVPFTQFTLPNGLSVILHEDAKVFNLMKHI